MQFCSVMSCLDKNHTVRSREAARPPGGEMWTENTTGLVEELEIEYNEEIYKSYDDVAYSPFLSEKITVGWPRSTDGWSSYPAQKVRQDVSEQGSSLGRPRGRWEVAYATGAVDFPHIRKWKEAAREDKVAGRRSRRPQAWKWVQALLEEVEDEGVKKLAEGLQNENVYCSL